MTQISSITKVLTTDETGFAGYCIASISNEIGEIDSICINPEHQNKNPGKRLIKETEFWLKLQNIVKIHVAVAEGNESSFGFYNKQGYNQRFTVFENQL